MKCPNCSAEVVGDVCEYCGSRFSQPSAPEAPKQTTPAATCPRCKSDRIAFSFVRGKNGALATSGACQNCGHCWLEQQAPQPTQRKTWLWVLGWLFLFPLPLTILLLRKQDMKPAVKYGLIAAAWILYLLIGLFGDTTQQAPLTAQMRLFIH